MRVAHLVAERVELEPRLRRLAGDLRPQLDLQILEDVQQAIDGHDGGQRHGQRDGPLESDHQGGVRRAGVKYNSQHVFLLSL